MSYLGMGVYGDLWATAVQYMLAYVVYNLYKVDVL
jgi:hypothetical protein